MQKLKVIKLKTAYKTGGLYIGVMGISSQCDNSQWQQFIHLFNTPQIL